MPGAIALSRIITRFGLQPIYLPPQEKDANGNEKEILITDNDANRPGLQLAGFYEYFNPNRIQIIGKMEHSYLENVPEEVRIANTRRFFAKRIAALVIARDLDLFPEMIELAKEFGIPLLKTLESTSTFYGALVSFLNLHLGKMVQRHGTLVEISGEGVFIHGDSGIGKSEVAIELIRRGHRFIADDAVEIRKVSEITLVGSAPDNLFGMMELRGVGLINIEHTFGSSALKRDIKIDLVIHLEQCGENNMAKSYERLGTNKEFTNILGVKVPSMTIPIKSGRNMAIIMEIAAITARERRSGYNAATEFLAHIGMENDPPIEVIKFLGGDS